MSKKKNTGQFDHYKKWPTKDMDYSFVAETKEDAEMYLKHIDVNPKDLKEVK